MKENKSELEKAEEIEKNWNKLGDDECYDLIKKFLKQEAKKLKVGCGERLLVHGDTYSCGKDTIMLCPDCLSIKKIKERVEG